MALISLSAASQENGLGNWLIYIGSKQLNSKWNLHHEISTEITIPLAISSNCSFVQGLDTISVQKVISY